MKSTRTAMLLMTTLSVATTACRADGDPGRDAGLSASYRLSEALCDGKRDCPEIDTERPNPDFGARIGLKDCALHKSAVVFGSWPIEGAASRPFKWQAEVRLDAVFPTRGQVVAYLGCDQEHPEVYSPVILLARKPDGLDWAKLDGDDVFIPFRGTAAIDHAFYATAVLDAPDGASERRVAISVEEPPLTPPTVHGGLGPGDSFSWGDHRATIVRIIDPRDLALGPIGWVEIKLSKGVVAHAP
jgi:hypothetical protein